MKSRTTSLLRWVSVQLGRAATFLDNLTNPTSAGSKFIDLAPTDKADKEGVYAEALNYATRNDRVFNIALTGPYGSGKISIIKSFLKRYPRPALNISLAAFVPGVDAASKEVHRQEIERSILQQMLYGADANRLPLSRFKRIRSVVQVFKIVAIMGSSRFRGVKIPERSWPTASSTPLTSTWTRRCARSRYAIATSPNS